MELKWKIMREKNEVNRTSLKTQEYSIKPSEMASLTNSRWQTRKERLNQTTNNEDMDETDIRYVVYE